MGLRQSRSVILSSLAIVQGAFSITSIGSIRESLTSIKETSIIFEPFGVLSFLRVH